VRRAIFTLGWQGAAKSTAYRGAVTRGFGAASDQSCAGEYALIAALLPAGRAGSLKAWQELADSLDVELSASWLVFRAPASRPGIPDEVRRAFCGAQAASTHKELVRAIRRVQAAAARSRVVTDFDLVARRCATLRRAGKRIVFTNGVFDLFHIGHLRLLQAARAQGDALVVGINSDESAKSLKGRARPVVPQFARAELVAAVRGVDFCAIFGQDDPRALLRAVRPDILAKGSEYSLSAVVGRRMVEGWGGRVILLPHVEGWSSTQVIGRLGSRTRGAVLRSPTGDGKWRD
jgi:D-beta-D-heptose 7-phosphate kinase/D-beta-D-heptose 1-phosphate adenosyltransferase